jgi:hypothetical protein
VNGNEKLTSNDTFPGAAGATFPAGLNKENN